MDRMPVEVMGLTLGTADGWDDHGDFMLQFYDFQPVTPDLGLPAGTPVFCFNTGKIETYDDAGETIQSLDMLDVLVHARQVLNRKD